jgi:chaperonin GroEL (HSP60 family)
VSKVKEMKQDEGFNAATETYEDLVKAGVIDPARSFATRCRTPRQSRRCC